MADPLSKEGGSLRTITAQYDVPRNTDLLCVGGWFTARVTDRDLQSTDRPYETYLQALAPAFLLRTDCHDEQATPPESCDHDWQPTFWRASYCPKCGWFLDHADGSLIPPKDKPDEQ